jgi:hypothetical protein
MFSFKMFQTDLYSEHAGVPCGLLSGVKEWFFASHRKSYYFQGHIAVRISENIEAATGIFF